MECSVKKCTVAHGISIVTKLDNGDGLFGLCPIHQLVWAMGKLKKEEVNMEISRISCQEKCELCNKDGLYMEEPDWSENLCEMHARKTILCNLSPEEFKKLHSKHGDVQLLSKKYYDSDGEALEPIAYIEKIEYKY